MNETVRIKECDSTNSEMKRMLGFGKKMPFALCSDIQTNGRGRHGKNFYSSDEKGLYVSFYFETAEQEKLLFITPLTAVAVCRALKASAEISPSIKWVNDIFLGNKKVCGILAEKTENGVIIGIGINLFQKASDFPDEIKNIATSVFAETGNLPDKEKVLSALCREMKEMLSVFPDDSLYREEYISRSLVLGKEVEYTVSGKVRRGKCVDILSDYTLKTSGDGFEDILSSSEVSLGSANFVRNDK